MVDDSDPSDPLIVLQEPIIINYTTHGNISQIKIEPWMKMTTEDIFFIRLSKVITMTEIDDIDIIEMYTALTSQETNSRCNRMMINMISNQFEKNVTRKMGFLGSISEKKKSLEDIFKVDIKDNHKETLISFHPGQVRLY